MLAGRSPFGDSAPAKRAKPRRNRLASRARSGRAAAQNLRQIREPQPMASWGDLGAGGVDPTPGRGIFAIEDHCRAVCRRGIPGRLCSDGARTVDSGRRLNGLDVCRRRVCGRRPLDDANARGRSAIYLDDSESILGREMLQILASRSGGGRRPGRVGSLVPVLRHGIGVGQDAILVSDRKIELRPRA